MGPRVRGRSIIAALHHIPSVSSPVNMRHFAFYNAEGLFTVGFTCKGSRFQTTEISSWRTGLHALSFYPESLVLPFAKLLKELWH